MNSFMIIAIVPSGYSSRVIKSANEVGATGGTIIHARGIEQPVKSGLFNFKIEPEEEIVLISATEEVTDAICNRIREEFHKNCKRSGSLYILPVQSIGDSNSIL